MPRYFCGTVPALAWIIDHYFYGGVHYTWLAEEFHPLETNPRSSNPYLIYGDLYWAGDRRDRYDKFVKGTREGLANGVKQQRKAGPLDDLTAARLKRVCMRCDVGWFYPVVYRVDMDRIDPGVDRMRTLPSRVRAKCWCRTLRKRSSTCCSGTTW